MSDRPRRAKQPVEVSRTQSERAKAAAMDYLREPKLSYRAAAERHGVNFPSHVNYWVTQWKGTLMETVAEAAAPAACGGVQAEAAAPAACGGEPSTSQGCQAQAPAPATAVEDLDLLPKHILYQRMVQEGVELTKKGYSLRAAADEIREKYKECGRGLTVSHTKLKKYQSICSAEALPGKRGREQILPVEFNAKMCEFVIAMRSLKFPLFRDQVIAAANNLLEGTTFAQSFKDKGVGKNWYYNSFMKEFKHRLGVGTIHPLEMERAKWATAENVGNWYAMVADAFVEAGVAVRNPDYSENAPAGCANSMPIFITEPGRILSFDETRTELDMTKASHSKSEKTLFDRKAPRRSRKEGLANKGGLSATVVGGGTADGKALPPFIIFAAESYAAEWTHPAPTSHFVGADNRYLSAKFGCNAKGGMQSDYGVMWLRDVVAPCFPDRSPEKKVIVLCDGHGSHLTLDVIEWCRGNNFSVVLRVPHTSHLTQGEDVVLFRIFKRLLRNEKIAKLRHNVSCGIHKLRSKDLIACITPAWEATLTMENILKSFRATGIVPFIRFVFYDLIESEQDTAAACERVPSIDYKRLSVSSFTGPAHESDEEDEHERLVHKSRFSSADVYLLGPIDSDRTYAIAKERAEAREAARKDKEARAQAKASKKSQKECDMVSSYNDFKDGLTSKASIRRLSTYQLKCYLHCADGVNKEKHKTLRNKKGDIVEYVLGLNSNLPEGQDDNNRARRRRPPSQRSSESEDESEEEDSSEGEQYDIESFLDARKRGRSYELLVRWEGFDESGDTWEPVSSLRQTQNSRVEEFIAQRKNAGTWPPR